MVRNVDKKATTPANRLRENKISRLGPTRHGAPCAIMENGELLSNGMHQRGDCCLVSCAAVAGRHVNIDRMDGSQSFRRNLNQYSRQCGYRRPPRTDSSLHCTTRQGADLAHEATIIGQIDVMNAVPQAQIRKRRGQPLEGTGGTYRDVHAGQHSFERRRVPKIRYSGLEARRVKPPAAGYYQVTVRITEQIVY